jgi:hypothetical protein
MCTDLSADLIIDARPVADGFYSLILNVAGTLRGRFFRQTYRLEFDRSALKYIAPGKMPEELEPF